MSIAGALLSLVSVAGVIATGAVPPPVTVTTQPAAPPAARGWAWPLDPPPEVVRAFEAPAQPWLPGHRGVDLAGAPRAVVRAPASGRIVFAGHIADRGVVVVAHESGLRSTFEPVTTALPEGTPVARGDDVGVLAATPGHCVPATCLHWGVLRGATYLDPLTLIGRRPVRLLPLD